MAYSRLQKAGRKERTCLTPKFEMPPILTSPASIASSTAFQDSSLAFFPPVVHIEHQHLRQQEDLVLTIRRMQEEEIDVAQATFLDRAADPLSCRGVRAICLS